MGGNGACSRHSPGSAMVAFLLLRFPGSPRSLRRCGWNDALRSGAQPKPVGLNFVGKQNTPPVKKYCWFFSWRDAALRMLAGVHSP